MKSREQIPLYLLLLFIVLSVGYSYFRFIVRNDYVVGYEGSCDPVTQSCFIGCNDDACVDSYYYAKIQKYAVDLYKECGEDITDCTAANTCLTGDRACTITYCDPTDTEDTCSTATSAATTTTAGNDSNP